MNKTISHFHYLTQDIVGIQHNELALRACQAGADWVQLRIKNKSYNEWLDIALKTKLICRQYHAKLIINDNVGIAKAVKADGVHLGKTDMSHQEARQLLGENAIIGGTANTFEEIEKLVAAGVDYIGLGPYRFTTTKENLSPVLGSEGYERIIEQCRESGITTPCVAVGGIKTEDVKIILEQGIYGIAVSSAINKAESITDAVKMFKNKVKFEVEKLENLKCKN